MDNKRLHAIAQATKTSKATVSKVLNFCYGVSGPVRDCVLRKAGVLGFKNARHAPGSGVYGGKKDEIAPSGFLLWFCAHQHLPIAEIHLRSVGTDLLLKSRSA